METKDIVTYVDHTLLTQGATWKEIKQICDDALTYGTASVCIPPSYVKQAKDYVQDAMAVCTVIGFPNGYMTTATKVFETEDALANGADEIDMVINIGWLKDKKYDFIVNEIKKIKEAAGSHILKVILETDLLTKEEIKKACELCIEAKADIVKTSTGFVKNGVGAKEEDVKLMYDTVSPYGLKVKASGGIRDRETAEKLIKAGASRLGTSSGVKIING